MAASALRMSANRHVIEQCRGRRGNGPPRRLLERLNAIVDTALAPDELYRPAISWREPDRE